MNQRILAYLSAGSLVIGLTLTTPINAAPVDPPKLSKKALKKIRSLPFGIKGQSSLILRSKHIDEVVFRGSGNKSHYGFILRGGIAKRGLWLRLRNSGRGGWANGSIRFSKPIKAKKYNSIVMWVRSDVPQKKFRITLQDDSWEDQKAPQSRSLILSTKKFIGDQIIQYSVPYGKLFASSPLDMGRISELGFEFGAKSVGNGKRGTIEIIGLAFVNQETDMRSVRMIPDEPAPPRVVKKPAKKVRQKPQVIDKAPEPFQPETEEEISEEIQAALNEEAAKAELEEETIAVAPPAPKPAPVVAKKVVEASAEAKQDQTAKQSSLKTYLGFVFNVFLFLISFAGAAFGLWFLYQKKKAWDRRRIGKILHEIKWTFNSPNDSSWHNDIKAQQQFWKRQAARGVTIGWLSTFYKSLKKQTGEEYHGENFLLKQVALAQNEGVNLIPSLCFIRTVFQYDTFLSRPELFLSKSVPASEQHLSDEELRVKYIGYFPIWVPPFWQKQHGLPQRILVAYGKMPGALFTNDSVQYNLSSPALKSMAVRVLKRMAKKANAVRIEGAASLLNSSLKLFWDGQLPEKELKQNREFWADVIRSVKTENPKFVFIADGVGFETRAIRNVGFDFYENDRIRETMVNQIRLETVGQLREMLQSESMSILNRSLYNLTPLFNSIHPHSASQSQNYLSAALLSLLPGKVITDGQLGDSFREFLQASAKWAAIRSHNFTLIDSDSPDVFSFARWNGKSLILVVANFALSNRDVNLQLGPFVSGFENGDLYLFNDALHGLPFLREIKDDQSSGPAVPILGQDVRTSGIPLKLSGLSLRVLSVTMSHPFAPAQRPAQPAEATPAKK